MQPRIESCGIMSYKHRLYQTMPEIESCRIWFGKINNAVNIYKFPHKSKVNYDNETKICIGLTIETLHRKHISHMGGNHNYQDRTQNQALICNKNHFSASVSHLNQNIYTHCIIHQGSWPRSKNHTKLSIKYRTQIF